MKQDTDIIIIEVESNATVEDVKVLLEVESMVQLDSQVLQFQGRTLTPDSALLSTFGI